ncbi:hypothetical protein B0H12DRAFT_1243686 [Mycena haematopus]|nr:hypothetical protein B0H12DRAFT_1243686 [Mycena haematopus]
MKTKQRVASKGTLHLPLCTPHPHPQRSPRHPQPPPRHIPPSPILQPHPLLTTPPQHALPEPYHPLSLPPLPLPLPLPPPPRPRTCTRTATGTEPRPPPPHRIAPLAQIPHILQARERLPPQERLHQRSQPNKRVIIIILVPVPIVVILLPLGTPRIIIAQPRVCASDPNERDSRMRGE